MAKIIFSYVGDNGHTQVVTKDGVMATDYDLTYSVALLHYITQDIKATGPCEKAFEPRDMFTPRLAPKYDSYLNNNAVIDTYLYVKEEGLTDEYVKRMLKDIIEFCMCKFNIEHFEIEWRLNTDEIFT